MSYEEKIKQKEKKREMKSKLRIAKSNTKKRIEALGHVSRDDTEKRAEIESYEVELDNKIKEIKGNYYSKYPIDYGLRITLIMLILVMLITPVSIYNNLRDTGKVYDYDDVLESQISENQIFKCEEEVYFVYIYKDGCSACEKVKSDVLAYVKKGSVKTYLFNTSGVRKVTLGEDQDVDNATTPEQLLIAYTPTLLKITIVDGKQTVTKSAYGSDSVVNLLYGKLN